MRSLYLVSGIIILTLLGVETGLTIGLGVTPGNVLIQGVPIGEVYELKIPLTIHNRSEEIRTYILRASRPSQIGAECPMGYLELPEEGFLYLEPSEIVIPPYGMAQAKIYLSIPYEDRYYNQHWVSLIEVKGKPHGGEGIALAAYPLFFIETEPRYDLTQRPDGLTGLRPAQVFLKDLPLGKIKGVTEVEIYNNDNSSHVYTIIPLTFSTKTKKWIGLSDSYEPLPDPAWIVPEPESLRIERGKSGIVSLGLNIPVRPEYYAKRWEGIVLVKREEGPPVFIRVLLRTAGE